MEGGKKKYGSDDIWQGGSKNANDRFCIRHTTPLQKSVSNTVTHK